MITHQFISQLPYAPQFRSLFFPSGSSWPCAEFTSCVMADDGLYDESHSFRGMTDVLSFSRLIGGGAIGIARAAAQKIAYNPTLVDANGETDVLVLVVLQGCGSFTQDGIVMQAGPGDIVFRHARGPSCARIDSTMKALILRIPDHRFLGVYVGNRTRCEPKLISRDAPSAALAASVALTSLRRLSMMSASEIYFTEQAVIRLFSAAYVSVASTVGSCKEAPRRWDHLIGLIDAEACDPELTLKRVAEKVGISKRFVHKLFQQNGDRFGNYLLACRLERARAELENPRLNHLNVSEIAYRSGFNDPSHFSRTFRIRFDASPSAYRRRFVVQELRTKQ
ncbi:helix-turn-helix transcriptional regulator [Paraburkholderia agricolaris]|uniref:Helix-turn-helix transcriptional regulator n=1 Tax=Paraburkholderia agricolaris TaxID=2152888 RepID=A0ABW9A0I8_9BURK